MRNTELVRAGGWFWKRPWGAVVLNAAQADISGIVVHNVSVDSSSYAGVHILGPHTINSTTLDSISITKSGTWGIEIEADAQGSASLHAVSIATSGTGAISNAAGGRFELRQHAMASVRVVSGDHAGAPSGVSDVRRKFDQLGVSWKAWSSDLD